MTFDRYAADPQDAPPSRKRRIFAWYLDLLLVGAVVTPIVYHFGILQYKWPIAVAAVTILELLVDAMKKRSPGDYVLGIYRDQQGGQWVDSNLLRRQHWFIVVVAFLQYYVAVRLFTDGVAKYDLFYAFGQRLEGPLATGFFVSVGMLTMFSAVALFRCASYAPALAIGLQLAQIANDMTSLPIAREVAAQVMERRALERGRSVPITPETLLNLSIIGSAVYLAMLLAAGVIFKARFSGERASSFSG